MLLAGLSCAAILAALLSPSVAAGTRPLSAISSRKDPAYISALSAANRFLQAWQNQDHETGLLMLTDAAKQHSSVDRLEAFFSCASDAAYEIARGKRLGAGRYVFPVTLFAAKAEPSCPRKSEIVVVRAGQNEWAIDRLP